MKPEDKAFLFVIIISLLLVVCIFIDFKPRKLTHKPMNILIESMTKLDFAGFTIRCWREEKEYDPITAQQTNIDIEKVLNNINPLSNRIDVAKTLIQIERMNAVEVLNARGEGCVIYESWP